MGCDDLTSTPTYMQPDPGHAEYSLKAMNTVILVLPPPPLRQGLNGHNVES